MAGRRKKQPKIFVLDTSVILYDHASINNFEENDVAIPISVLEELDNFKNGLYYIIKRIHLTMKRENT